MASKGSCLSSGSMTSRTWGLQGLTNRRDNVEQSAIDCVSRQEGPSFASGLLMIRFCSPCIEASPPPHLPSSCPPR